MFESPSSLSTLLRSNYWQSKPVFCLCSFTNKSKTNPVCYVRSDRIVPRQTGRDPASVSHDWNSLVCQLAAGILTTLAARAAALWRKRENFEVPPNSLGHRSVWGWLRVQLDGYGGRGLAPDQINQGWRNRMAYFFYIKPLTEGAGRFTAICVHWHVIFLCVTVVVSQIILQCLKTLKAKWKSVFPKSRKVGIGIE